MSLYLFVILILSGQGFFLGAIMAARKGKRFSDYLLILLVFFFSYHVFYIFLVNSGYIANFRFLIGTCFVFQPLVPVLLYWYLARSEGLIARSDYWHLLPFLLQLAYWIPFLSMPSEMKLNIIQGHQESLMYKVIGFKGGVLLQMGLFLYYALKLRKIRIDSLKVWDQVCRQVFLLISLLFIFDGILYLLVPDTYFPFAHLVLAGVIYFLAYHTHNNQNLVYGKPKYSGVKLDTNHMESIMLQLEKYMSTEKPYLNQDLRIRDISAHIGWPTSDISQAINTSKSMSFRDFVNQYRVEEAKLILSNRINDNQKNLAVAFNSGFNNKVSFYKSFTKFVGMTPKQFRRKFT